ncbi:asparagine synthetase B family protein, partial [Magnetococcales bacterium HHB-1]
AREMAKHVGAHYHEVQITEQDFLDFLPQFVRYTDEPMADVTSVPLYYLCALAKTEVKALLGGEGADEILTGYTWDRQMQELDFVARYLNWIPGPLLKVAANMLAYHPSFSGAGIKALAEEGFSGFFRAKHLCMTHHWSEKEKQKLILSQAKGAAAAASTDALIEGLYDQNRSDHPLDQLQQNACQGWLVEDLLMKSDKMSMAASVELRAPFLDHHLAEWAATLPLSWKVGSASTGYQTKRILRHFAKGRIPQTIINRPKKGFAHPTYRWLEKDSPLGSWARDRLFHNEHLKAWIVPEAANATYRQAQKGNWDAVNKIMVLIVLGYWLEAWG